MTKLVRSAVVSISGHELGLRFQQHAALTVIVVPSKMVKMNVYLDNETGEQLKHNSGIHQYYCYSPTRAEKLLTAAIHSANDWFHTDARLGMQIID